MNEEAFNDSFNLFASQGYNGSLEDYKELMIDNNEAFKDSYNLFKSEGYNGSENEFAELIGVDSTIMLTDDELGKTNDSADADPSVESNAMGSNLVGGSLAPRDASNFDKTQEKATAFERQFGKNEFTDFFGDL